MYVNIFVQIKHLHKIFSDFTLDDVTRLHQLALAHVSDSRASPCRWLYRNKTLEYFEEIIYSRTGVMTIYPKGHSGDPASQINGRLEGLFFLASVNSIGLPIWNSQFGSSRLLAPAEVLMSRTGNLYFADFYCLKGMYHYVILVMTKPGSYADYFCGTRLLQLGPHDNPFFFRLRNSGLLSVSTRDHLIVELCYTEDIDLREMIARQGALMQHNIPAIGKQCKTEGGIPKNPTCRICNL